MNKIQFLILMFFSLLILLSCSDDNESINELVVEVPTLPIKQTRTEISSSSTIINISEFIYDIDNKLVRINLSEDGINEGYFKIVYENNKIIRLETYNNDGDILNKSEFTYNNENIVKDSYFEKINTAFILEAENIYSYNSNDNLISLTENEFFNNQQNTHTTTFEYLGNNILRGNREDNETYEIQFDNNKNPFSEIPFFESFTKTRFLSLNNRISETIYLNGTVISESTYDNITSNSFLTKQSQANVGGNIFLTNEFIYNK